MIAGIIQALLPSLGKVAEQYFDSKDKKEAFENAVQLEILKNGKAIEDQAGAIILAEAKSESWLTSSWRPLMMLIFVSIVGIHMLIVPYLLSPLLWMLGAPVPTLEPIPDQVWTLLQIGIGGYVGGRSVEKAVKHVAEMKKETSKSLKDY